MANLCIKTPSSATYVLKFQLLVLRPRPKLDSDMSRFTSWSTYLGLETTPLINFFIFSSQTPEVRYVICWFSFGNKDMCQQALGSAQTPSNELLCLRFNFMKAIKTGKCASETIFHHRLALGGQSRHLINNNQCIYCCKCIKLQDNRPRCKKSSFFIHVLTQYAPKVEK